MLMTLEKICSDLEAVNSRAVALFGSLTGEALARRSNPTKWSVAENLIHLRITTETFLPWMEHAIDETRQRGFLSAGPYRLGAYGNLLVWYVEPPARIKAAAPAPLKPLLTGPPEEVLPAFLQSQRHAMQQMKAAHGLDLTKLRFGSPLAKFVRMNLLELFAVFNGHSRRHLWQAENTLGKTEPPVN